MQRPTVRAAALFFVGVKVMTQYYCSAYYGKTPYFLRRGQLSRGVPFIRGFPMDSETLSVATA
jgi:hypothetical protein